MQVSILIADSNEIRVQQIIESFHGQPQFQLLGIAKTKSELLAQIDKEKVDVILTSLMLLDGEVIFYTEEIHNASPATRIFALAETQTPELINRCKEAGFSGVFTKSFIEKKQVAQQLWQALGGQSKAPAQSVQEEPESYGIHTTTEEINKAVVLLHSPKGGVGKTTLAINLAIELKKLDSSKTVTLVDLDLYGANLSTVIFTPPLEEVRHKNIVRWKNLNLEMLRDREISELLFEGPEGIKYAAAPFNFSESHLMDHETADKALKAVIRYSDIVVIDGGPGITDAVDLALHHATHILAVTNPEGQSLTQISKMINALSCPEDFVLNISNDVDLKKLKKAMEAQKQKMRIVVNHTVPITKYSLDLEEIQQTLGMPVYAEVPYSEHILEALHGKDSFHACQLDNGGSYSGAIKNLARQIMGLKVGAMAAAKAEKPPKKLFGLLGRKKS